MDFLLTEDQQAFQSMARDFAEQELLPYAKDWDEQHFFPVETLRKAASLGFGGIYVQEAHGGSGLSRLDAAIIFEELSTGCVSTAAYLSIHNMVSWIIDAYGNQAQREKWLPNLTSMNFLASYCLTEPGSGSDAAALKTTAVRDGDYYILNGSKAFISGGSVSDVYCCMVRTGDNSHHGISCILVEKDSPGLSFGKKEQKLGWNSQPTSMVFFENCRVPVSNLIGEEGIGFKIALSALDGGRVNIAACSLGGAKACLLMSQRYMDERQQFGHKLANFQSLQFKLAGMATHFEAARLMVRRAAASIDQQLPDKTVHAAMAKHYTTDTCFDICNQALQIHGGYGYLKEYPIERYFRDLRVHQILEGTNEIMHVIIAKQLLANKYHFD